MKLRYDEKEQENNLDLQVEVDELLNKLSVTVDQMCGGFTHATTQYLPTAALAERLEKLLVKLSVKAQPTTNATKAESLIVEWICTLIDTEGSFSGQATELNQQFQTENSHLKRGFGLGWPDNPMVFGKFLSKMDEVLRKRGVKISSKRTSLGRLWIFESSRDENNLPIS